MIFALRHPSVLLGLVLGFLIGITLRVALQRLLARRLSGVGRARLRPVNSRRRPIDRLRPQAGWGAYLDPYGTVAAVLSGVGWGVRPMGPRRLSVDAGFLGIALAVHGALCALGLWALTAAGFGPLSQFGDSFDIHQVLHGTGSLSTVGQSVSIGFAMINLACGLLALVPIPPLELGVLLWSRLPRSPGARKLAYRVLEEPWGIAVVLVLLLLPLAGQTPLLLALIDDAAHPILGAL